MLGARAPLSNLGRYVAGWLHDPEQLPANPPDDGENGPRESARSDRRATDGRGAPSTEDADHYHFQFVPGEDPVSGAVVAAAARVHGVDELSLRPLAEVVDPDALDAVFTPGTTDATPTHGTVALRYEGLEMTVDGGGHIHVRVP